MQHAVSESGMDRRKAQDSGASEYNKILTEIRLTYQALEEQVSRLEHLTQEITTIKDQLQPVSLEHASKYIIDNAFSGNVEERKKTIFEICVSLVSFINSLKKPHNVKNSYTHQLALLDSYLEELKTSVVGQNSGIDSLSLSEGRIVSMIKIGMTTDQIAECLHISSDTVKTHRRNIRRKLDIVGKKDDLASHLRVVDEADSKGQELQGSTGPRSLDSYIPRI
jgi:DNA-binding CsgD family transcriptional regulator